MFGGLHIMGLAALKTTENVLESSWWQENWFRQVLQHVGKQTPFLKASHITPT